MTNGAPKIIRGQKAKKKNRLNGVLAPRHPSEVLQNKMSLESKDTIKAACLKLSGRKNDAHIISKNHAKEQEKNELF